MDEPNLTSSAWCDTMVSMLRRAGRRTTRLFHHKLGLLGTNRQRAVQRDDLFSRVIPTRPDNRGTMKSPCAQAIFLEANYVCRYG